MNQGTKIFFWSLSAALGGFLFGFDTAVISGVEKHLQSLWNLSAVEHGLTVSIALIGTVVGALLGGIPADTLGRKKTLLMIAVIYLLASLGTALAHTWSFFLIFRFLGGVGVGISSIVAPLYITEIAPPARRGRLVAMFQFNIVFGILIAYLSNYLLSGIDPAVSWRWMLGVQAFPSLLFLITALIIPESPRWLILKKNNLEDARKTLEIIDPAESEKTISAILNTSSQTGKTAGFSAVFGKAYRKPLLLALLFAFFNQVSGINAIIYYAPRIFELAGLGKESALLSSAGIGLVNLLSTFLGLALIDKYGRKTLMIAGSAGLILSLALVTQAFYRHEAGMMVPIYLFMFIAFFAFSQGAVIWVFIAEIFPNEVRAYGQTLGSSTHWIMAALISFSFPMITETFGGAAAFGFFTVMMICQLLFAWKIMPETKGKSLEDMDTIIISH
ncbi:MAG: sugar porter family MFS transporter [Leadbetterella sp.]|nr:sugar porter family MFS transporter [Leadbetterella sp.]